MTFLMFLKARNKIHLKYQTSHNYFNKCIFIIPDLVEFEGNNFYTMDI